MRVLITILLLNSTFASAATAEERRARIVSAEELCRGARLPGERVAVTGKYRELIDNNLYLNDCDVSLALGTQELRDALLEFTSQKDNLTVEGVIAVADGRSVVRVSAIRAAPRDFSLFLDSLEVLRRGSRFADAVKLISLGQRIQKSKDLEDRGPPLARRAFEAALEVAGRDHGGNTGRRMLDLVRRIHTITQDDSFARDLLVRLADQHPDSKEIAKHLISMGCRRHDSRWVTRAEFMRAEGFVPVRSRGQDETAPSIQWVTPAARHFDRAARAIARTSSEALLLLRRRTAKEYLLMAEDGKVEPGMQREEVCLALGFPTYVNRRTHEKKEFDQWLYGARYYYFYDGMLVYLAKKR